MIRQARSRFLPLAFVRTSERVSFELQAVKNAEDLFATME